MKREIPLPAHTTNLRQLHLRSADFAVLGAVQHLQNSLEYLSGLRPDAETGGEGFYSGGALIALERLVKQVELKIFVIKEAHARAKAA